MSTPISIQVPVAGNPNSTEDPKIAANFSALSTWFANPQISSTDLATNAVASSNITGGAVIAGKLGTSAVLTDNIADSAITTAKIANGAVVTDDLASVSVSRSKIRVFTLPQYVTALPASVSGTATWASGDTSLSVSVASGTPQVGQLVTGTGIATDTVITTVTGSSSPFSITLSRPTTAAGSSVTVTIAPQDGDEVYYAADATNGVIWHLRYRSGSSSSYKWEFVGGAPLRVLNGWSGTSTSTAWVTNAFTGTASTALPLSGDYNIELNGVLTPTTNGGILAALIPTTLNAAITGTSTGTFTVVNGSVLSDISEAYVVDATGAASEWVTATYASSTTITVSARGQRGTTAATHSTGLPLLGYTSNSAIISPSANSTYGMKSTIREGLASGAKIQVAGRSTGSTNCNFDGVTVVVRPTRVG